MFFTRYQIFRWSLGAFLVGVAFSYLGIYGVWDALMLCGAACALIFFGRKKRIVLCVGIISLSFFGGAARTLIFEQSRTHALPRTPFSFSGTILGQSFLPDGRQNILINIDKGGGMMRMHVSSSPLYHIDDHVEGACKTLYTALSTQSVQSFHGASELCRYGSIESAGASSVFIVRIIHGFKNTIGEALSRGLPSPESDLLSGLLIGSQGGASSSLADIFRRAGISHIVAISGYNISLVIAALWSVLRYAPFGRRKSMWILAGGTIVFVAVTGASPSSVRAAIMGIAVLLAQYLGRSPHTITTLLFTAAMMVFVDPSIVLFNVGFELSFLATLGLVIMVPLLSAGEWMPPVWGLRDIALQSIAATLFTEPVIFATFHTVSVVGLAANLAILPVIPIIMILGFAWSAMACATLVVERVFSFSLHGIITILGIPLYGFLTYVVHAASWFASLPFALLQVDTGMWTPVVVCAWYGMVWFTVYALRQRAGSGVDPSA